MAKFYLTLLIAFFFSSASAQRRVAYHVNVYSKTGSKYSDGYILSLNDTTVTISRNNKERTYNYSDIERIKVYKDSFRALFIPAYVGVGFIASSPFKSTLKSGLKTAGIGSAIIILAYAIDTAIFYRPIETINGTDPGMKNKLSAYSK